MTEKRFETEYATPGPGGSKPRRWISNLVWLFGGGALAILLVVDPWGLHRFDSWLHATLGHGDAATDAHDPSHGPSRNLWTCGMHPEVILEESGQCPICGMNLVPLETDEVTPGPSGASPESSEDREILYYRHPHDSTVVSEVPAKDAMGMDFIPIYSEGVAESGPTVTIDPRVVQNMNVVIEPVEIRDLSREIRTVGYLDFDQQKMVSVTTKYNGFVEKVYVNYIGEPVAKGQKLFEIYAPELVQTQQELLSALTFVRRLESSPPDARRRAEALAEAARTRLGYWDIGEDQIRRIEESGEPIRSLGVHSPAQGVVMMRMPGLEGMSVKPGMELFHISDLSTLWLSVEIFEDQLPWLETGSGAEIRLSYFPGEVFYGEVRFVEPQLDEKTRTVGLRIEVPNAEGRLRAGMYATVRFRPVAAPDAIAVPAIGLIRTGERNLVIVAEGEGRFSPREVVLGVQGDEYIQVLSGLSPGEQIVTSAQFLLDSESNLREAIQKLIAGKKDVAVEARGEPPVVPEADRDQDAMNSSDHAGH